MDLGELLPLIEETTAYRHLADELAQSTGRVRALVLNAARPYLVAAIYRRFNKPLLLVTAQPERARQLAEQLTTWCGCGVMRLPEAELLAFQGAIGDSASQRERLNVLSVLAFGKDKAPLVVAAAPSMVHKVADYNEFAANHLPLKKNMKLSPRALVERLVKMGYENEVAVTMPGCFSRRGGIVDVYPPTSQLPVRLEFLGDSIDSIRLFEPSTQLSLRPVTYVEIGPAAEVLPPSDTSALDSLKLDSLNEEARSSFEEAITHIKESGHTSDLALLAPLFNDDCLLSYLPNDSLVVIDEPEAVYQAVDTLNKEVDEIRHDRIGRGELPPDFPCPYFSWGDLRQRLEDRRSLELYSLASAEEENCLPFSAAPVYAGRLSLFFKKTNELLSKNHRIVIVSQQAERLAELLSAEEITTTPIMNIGSLPKRGSLTLVQALLEKGWVLGGSSHIFTDNELFGFVKQQRLSRKRPASRSRLYVDIKPGEYVVHVDHGVALFSAVTTLERNGTSREYMVLEYAGGDKIYVPTDQIERVSRYIGSCDRPPILSRLGSGQWARAKQKAGEAAEEIAAELLKLYAAREVVSGHSYAGDTVWQQELEASFPYVETPDQLTAQQEIKEDMERPKPMDRFILGDVGYGKTELALRAAFKAVMEGKQVAVLVPTTVLAQQHYATFRQRLVAFPVRIEVLSRFRTAKEQQEIISDLKSGTADICIGTHRLLQPDVVFKDLGLLIIDEEQRFGVYHKEHLKRMRRQVDVLTMSATPIPRTLHMALSGVRDMSLIETPPEERLPAKTYVAAWDDRLVREAILRELERAGQVFFVHNRVEGIENIRFRLEQLVPEATFALGHGQLPEGELEKVMAGFAEGRVDVLVCTTIIESGLDIPNANTLIIHRADGFGLTQLYQLRGRVGRGANLAYAYLLYEKGRRLTPDALKRLRTMFEASELGAGYGIAMKDLEIRGAGTLLGTRQSGHISAVGFNLYTRLLADAVEEQKAKREGKSLEELKASRLPPPSVDLPLSAFIPTDYVSDLDSRLELYQRLSMVKEEKDLESLKSDFKDRFGAPPLEVTNLLYAVRLKLKARKANVGAIISEGGQVIVRMLNGMIVDERKLRPLSSGVMPGHNQIGMDLNKLGGHWRQVLEGVLERLKEY